MNGKEFSVMEERCQQNYIKAGQCYHVCSAENHNIMFRSEAEYREAMNIVAFVSFMFADVAVYTFQIMSNHFHFVMAGDKRRIEEFMHMLVVKLCAAPALIHSVGDVKSLEFRLIPVESLNNLRNVIAYTNRNGFVVNQAHSPFSYPWGANRYFFNPEAMLRVRCEAQHAVQVQKRELFHSNQLAKNKDVVILDGYVPPACYCRIHEAEGLFRSCHHYFHCVSRNVESARDIAKSIGESVFYSDDELFSVVGQICSKKFESPSALSLTVVQKSEVARILHFEYNATNKQIARMLRLGVDVVNQLFPSNA